MKTLLCLSLLLAVVACTHYDWVPSTRIGLYDDHAISFKVALKPQNLKTLDSLFWQISDPSSPLYGKFLSQSQITELISLPEEQIAAVEAYLKSFEEVVCPVVIRRSAHQDYILVDTCAAQAKKIFPNLNLVVYEKFRSNKRVIRSLPLVDVAQNLNFLGVPANLHEYIAGVHDLTDLPVELTNHSKIDPELPWLKSDKLLSITEIIGRFGVNAGGLSEEVLAVDDGQVRQAVIEFNHAGFNQSELTSFQDRYGVPNVNVTIVGTQVVNEKNGDYLEVSLDVDTITSIAQGVQTWDFVFDAAASFIDVVETLMTTKGAPHVLSCSWGGLESQFTQAKMDATNTAFMKLGLAGFTFFVASGDSGPTLNPQQCDIFDAQFPATSAYIVSVGGTKVTAATNVEGAWFRGSGGFSKAIARPAYQEAAVSKYLAVNDDALPPNPKGERYTTTGRAYPDVSAFGAYYDIAVYGTFKAMGAGTSAATPQFAGVITLINIHRYINGLGSLGPLNPALYQLKEGVGFDVVEGQTYAISEIACVGQYLPGFKAVEGWDPATGLGSPRFPVLLSQLANLGKKDEN